MKYDIRIYKKEYQRPAFLKEDRDKYNWRYPWVKYKYVHSLKDGSPVYEERHPNELESKIQEVDDYTRKESYKKNSHSTPSRLNDFARKDEKQDGCLVLPIIFIGCIISILPIILGKAFGYAATGGHHVLAFLCFLGILGLLIRGLNQN